MGFSPVQEKFALRNAISYCGKKDVARQTGNFNYKSKTYVTSSHVIELSY
ncbi:hypothetical protein D8I24_5387 [Cupriavidus necator H850]|nr:hypothetical protein D8I24_5387 [Cupriavidus necator H850]